MPPFEAYLAELRHHLGNGLSEDAERELRAHFEEAIAAHREGGLSPEEAEVAAISQLGRPEDVAMAFRRERPAWMYRFAGGLGGMATGLHQHWRPLVLATLMAGLLGAATGQALPPTYQARATLELLGSRDYGSALGVQEALQRVRAGGVRLEPAPPGQGVNLALAIESTSPDRDAASAMAQAEAEKAIQSLGEALRDTRYNSRDMQLRLGSEVQVEEKRPVPLAAAVGGTLAFAVGVLVLFRQRHLGRS